MPTLLYKYVVPDRIDVLVGRKIRFTQACFLNDPFEFNPGMPEANPEELGHLERKKADQRAVAYHEKSRLFGVLSLTEKKDSVPMWVHYAASHAGFLIGFDTASTFFQQALRERKLQKVQYLAERVNYTRGLPGTPHVGPDGILSAKSTEWEYEQEWRWIERCNPSNYAQVAVAPNGELLFLRSLPPESIREVTLGYRAGAVLAESIQALKLTPEYRGLRVSKIMLDKSHYRLHSEPI